MEKSENYLNNVSARFHELLQFIMICFNSRKEFTDVQDQHYKGSALYMEAVQNHWTLDFLQTSRRKTSPFLHNRNVFDLVQNKFFPDISLPKYIGDSWI